MDPIPTAPPPRFSRVVVIGVSALSGAAVLWTAWIGSHAVPAGRVIGIFVAPLSLVGVFAVLRRFFRCCGRAGTIAFSLFIGAAAATPVASPLIARTGFLGLPYVIGYCGWPVVLFLAGVAMAGAAAWDIDFSPDRRRPRKTPGEFVLREPD